MTPIDQAGYGSVVRWRIERLYLRRSFPVRVRSRQAAESKPRPAVIVIERHGAMRRLRWLALASIAVLVLSGSLSATSYQVLYSFAKGQDGTSPWGGVAMDGSGNLFGVTAAGGDFSGGTVFELSYSPQSGWTKAILHSFNYLADGENPDGTLVFDSAGNLYGTTPGKGPQGVGTVYELSPNGNGWDFILLFDEGVHGGVVLDKAGNVYAPLGFGQYNAGAIGQLSPSQSGWNYSAIFSFCFHRPQCFDGIEPQAPLAWDAAGNLYGNTLYGGIFPYPSPCFSDEGCGLVFQLRPRPDGTWADHILHWFGGFGTDGAMVNPGLVVDGKGNVYGTTFLGGPNFFSGTVYELSPKDPGLWGQSVGYVENQIYTFPDCALGCGPFGVLARDNAGNLYGAAGGGNPLCGGDCGVVFRLSPQRDGTWKYTMLHAFNSSDGAGPNGVTMGTDGNLYGTTTAGGQYNGGVVFEITP